MKKNIKEKFHIPSNLIHIQMGANYIWREKCSYYSLWDEVQIIDI